MKRNNLVILSMIVLIVAMVSSVHAASCNLYLQINGSSTYDIANGLTVTVGLLLNINVTVVMRERLMYEYRVLESFLGESIGLHVGKCLV